MSHLIINIATTSSQAVLQEISLNSNEAVLAENGWQIVSLAIQPDHVHLFLRANPYTLPTDIARLIKGRSSCILREEFEHLRKMPSLWTRSAFYSTAGNVSSEIIQNYIEKQSTG